MSISRQLVRDIFRMLDEPLMRPGYIGGLGHGHGLGGRYNGHQFGRPALDVREEGNKYVLEAELPGVRKDNVEVRIGDGGKSVTIEGKVVEEGQGVRAARAGAGAVEGEGEAGTGTGTAVATATDEGGNQIAAERTFVHNASFRRTVWLPRPVDSHDVGAKLDHGILTVSLKKAKDKGSVVVPVE